MRTRSAGLLLAAAATALLPTAPAHAANVAGVATGSGSVRPGITLVPTDQRIEFILDVGVGATTNGQPLLATGCRYEGVGIQETLLAGSGSGTLGNCTIGSISGVVQYSRVLNVTTIVGRLQIEGALYDVELNCVVTPTSAEPVLTYTLSCAVR